ncbi:MAG TPA: putative glycolipid-binding domain-containing protein, partial [Gemmatimonadales bacterium]|nr:putative glycolipid-binding domain-containing protein [Gemmatimonadales bacterium]
AWLNWPAGTLSPLLQRYRRDTRAEYSYEADLPDATRFAAVLQVAPSGWVLDYGGLWRARNGA